MDKIIRGGVLDAGAVRSHKGTFSAERLYENQKITDLVSKAETEQADYRRAYPINVFFGPKKYLGRFFLQRPGLQRLGVARLHL